MNLSPSELSRIPALSIQQPYAWAIVEGLKDIENRSWPTKYRGPLLIHAGRAKVFSDAVEDVAHRGDLSHRRMPTPQMLTLGAVIGIVELVDCVEASDSPWFVGKFGFVLTKARKLSTPIPCRGRLGFFKVA